jgi:hypothetical protein
MFGAALDFFAAGPARIKALLVGALAMVAVCLTLTAWALLERAGRLETQVEVERARTMLVRERDQIQVLAAAVGACSAGVELAKQVGDAAIAGTSELVEAARRLKRPAVHTREVIERLIEKPVTAEQANDCNWGWAEIEAEHRRRNDSQNASRKDRAP